MKLEIDPFIKEMQSEVLDLAWDLVIPFDVKSFAELHDYIDANCLGGFCREDFNLPLIAALGGWDDPDNENPCQNYIDFVTGVQNGVDAWIRAGNLKEDCGYYEGALSDFAPLIRSEAMWRHLAGELLAELVTHGAYEGRGFELVQKARSMFKERTR